MKQLLSAIVFLSLSFNLSSAWARRIEYKPMVLPSNGLKKIVINLEVGDIDIQEIPKGRAIEIQSSQEQNAEDELVFSHRVDNDVLELFVSSSQSQTSQNKPTQARSKINLLIKSPSLPLQVVMRSGSFDSQSWKSNLELVVHSGTVKLRGQQGDSKIVIGTGSLNVDDQSGALFVDSFNSKVELAKIQGPAKIQNFSGSTTVVDSDGTMSLESYKAFTKVTKSKGKLIFRLGKSPIKIENFDGEIRGSSKEGPVNIVTSGKASIRLDSVDAPVNIKTENSGANVNLGSKSGAILAPKNLKAESQGSFRLMLGRLKGSEPGSIVVRTETGEIRVQ